MDCTSTSIPYQQIGAFSKIILDYLDGKDELKPFFKHPPTLEGIKQSIQSRIAFNTDRELLVSVLKAQYDIIGTAAAVQQNIDSLSGDNSFTIVTAHQPNIFTGYLYFVYKILHTIKLATYLAVEMPHYKFVPVYYMGSEDADLDELGNIHLNGDKIVWETKQKGAVGRMKNTGLEKMIERVSGELSVFPFGEELVNFLKKWYLNSPDIQTATFKLVNSLFAHYGLIVLLPDNPRLKHSMQPVFEDDLLNQAPSVIVEKTIHSLAHYYKVQASPREINLFYLKDDIRERIVKEGDEWRVVGTETRFSKQALLNELQDFPERFSPNVILRGIFQETILPNIAFIGGGGEMAYWLELKDLFDHYDVPFPVLLLRNSFLFIEARWRDRITSLGFSIHDIFKEERLLTEELVKRESVKKLDLSAEINQVKSYYDNFQQLATAVDVSLKEHVNALQTRAVKQLHTLEKKMLKAEARKFSDQQKQVHLLKDKLFPNNGLQERVDNFMPFYAKFGKEFIDVIYDHSPAIGQDFVVLVEND